MNPHEYAAGLATAATDALDLLPAKKALSVWAGALLIAWALCAAAGWAVWQVARFVAGLVA